MEKTKWIDVDKDGNMYVSIMKLGTDYLVRVGIYDEDKDCWSYCNVIPIPEYDIPIEWLSINKSEG